MSSRRRARGFAVRCRAPDRHRRVDAHDFNGMALRRTERPVAFCPWPVGPSATHTSRPVAAASPISRPLQEQMVELRKGEPRPGGTSVIALVRGSVSSIWRSRGIHFGQVRRRCAWIEVRQASVPRNLSTAPSRLMHPASSSRSRMTAPTVAQYRRCEERRHATQRKARGPERIELKSGALPAQAILEHGVELVRLKINDDGLQKMLRGDPWAASSALNFS